ncbi:MutS-related protein [Granulicella mallensis]|uniref:DNA mismatch repair protein MutS domain protein n=1 Tax=Granulicella mallensis (strain ATCC BAA-1857 / DSM 23137 / MP5ACTX8) TaxID=682795 RepID=G8NXX4_GRAMM|nr:DNA mismatch repair protein MutS domain-containing protein [Granulicella mallensis]AEU35562.1 DNA mismatch repair protein MutS domain protein [Granulicella mallensis MP5ACTX8]
MTQAISEEYERRRAASAGEYARETEKGARFTLFAFVALVFCAYFLWSAIRTSGSLWLVAAAAGFCSVATVLSLRTRRSSERASRLSALYEEGMGRVNGEAPQSGFTGESFAEAGHLYERDLNVLGKDSLFGMLATTRTMVGQRALARMLLRPAEAHTVRQRQAAVQELAPQLDLRERVALLGRWAFEELPAESFEVWLDAERSNFPRWVRSVLLLLTFAWATAIAAGLIAHVEISFLVRNVVALLGLQNALCLWLRPRVHLELEATKKLGSQIAVLREGLRLMRNSNFAAERLVALQRGIEDEDRALAQLQRHLVLVEQRATDWFYVPSLLIGAGTHAALSLDRWKQRFAEPMRNWLDAWAEFEALLALATYTAEHAENVYPEVVDEGQTKTALFEAEAMTHPLLLRSEAVANDVSLGNGVQFLLISGSNMAGKSTLLRTIGANAVLALAGVPVPVKRMKLSVVHLGASLALTDSLAEGKSKFLAEVERLRDVLALARANPASSLFLIDEIFSGTNSLDRRAAAKAVLRGLVATGAVGALSTHDLALAELAEKPELHGSNVHMASPDEADPLGFDYLLKPGINRTTNALAIVRLLGLDS